MLGHDLKFAFLIFGVAQTCSMRMTLNNEGFGNKSCALR